MLRRLSAIGLVASIALGCQTQGQVPGKSKDQSTTTAAKKTNGDLKSYADVITSSAKSDDGLFTSHFVGDKLYFEIPVDLFEKDMLLVSRIAKVPAGFGGGYVNAGSKVNEQVV